MGGVLTWAKTGSATSAHKKIGQETGEIWGMKSSHNRRDRRYGAEVGLWRTYQTIRNPQLIENGGLEGVLWARRFVGDGGGQGVNQHEGFV